MSHRPRVATNWIFVWFLLLSACVPAATPTPDVAATRVIEQAVAATLTAQAPTATPTPVPSAEVKTGFGMLVIKEVAFSNKTPSEDAALSGYKVLTIWLERKDGEAMDSDQSFGLLELGIYVQAESGAQSKIFSINGTLADGQGFMMKRIGLSATPIEADKNFTLFWPENAPIPLGK
jgi:hypothetical protein